MRLHHAFASTILSAPALYACITPLEAQTQTIVAFDIPAQPLDGALRAISRAAGVQILFNAADVAGIDAPAIHGEMESREALSRLIDGRGLVLEYADSSYFVKRLSRPAHPRGAGENSTPIVVTGSRIAGSTASSGVITVSAEQMRDAGQYQLGDVARSIPQNFNGGQNPGVLYGSSNANDLNVNSATAVNLRGLGVDATLTLLNGKRLAYDSAIEAIDISAIPVAAVDRMELLTEGASAVYGSDAVAGVANIVLKKDYEGFNAVARLGAATDGGDFEKQFSLTGGQRWYGGGFLIAGDYGRNSAIYAGDRSAASNMNESSTLYPHQSHYGVVATGHQRILDGLTFDVDAFYNRRNSFFTTAITKAADYLTSGQAADTKINSFVVSPRLTWDINPGWSVALLGTYGQDKTRVALKSYSGGAQSSIGYSWYKNDVVVGEINAVGTLFMLPGGDAKIAMGGGYRRNDLDSKQSTVTATATIPGTHISPSRSSFYLYAETDLPVISSANDIAGIYRLSFTGAVRYEKYRDIGDIATPKLGVVYSPIDGLSLRSSWGKSFKAPTMRQLYLTQRAYLDSASYYAPSSLPDNAAVLQLSGGNPDLKPERAESWSVGAIITPHQLPGLRLEVSYFHTDYRDRVVTPLQGVSGALTNPLYETLITADPTTAELEAAIATASQGLQNYTGLPYDPTTVAYIVDNRNRNAARQKISGIDATIAYRLATSGAGTFNLSGNLTYLKSSQQLLDGGATVQLAGTVYRPPHWRGRGGITWNNANLTAATFLSYVGGVEDQRLATVQQVSAMTTFDFNLRYAETQENGKGASVSINVTNLFNKRPDAVRSTAAYIPAYDSTNYSVIGRYIGVALEKGW
ncbi:TonB-dependent receptor domain-containing protein [Sphingobium yanoikuyae]|jgi:iron complex outermembrane receptor protein|uniref:TonB-dependent receptor domain-containing protein n=1 Tax=Sphingobium yanoikuyae TaxID=13690 RepID=UPI0035C832F9